jgi:hypothetical protein
MKAVPIVPPMFGPNNMDFIVAEMPRLLQHTLLTRGVHPAQLIACNIFINKPMFVKDRPILF